MDIPEYKGVVCNNPVPRGKFSWVIFLDCGCDKTLVPHWKFIWAILKIYGNTMQCFGNSLKEIGTLSST
ncbi:hypothetical protein CsSME_00000382 [Camellia sinensis var. sinensis]